MKKFLIFNLVEDRKRSRRLFVSPCQHIGTGIGIGIGIVPTVCGAPLYYIYPERSV